MRNPSQAILLAVLMASLILPPNLTLATAARSEGASGAAARSLLLVGDSLSIGLGKQLEGVFAGRSGVSFAHLGKVSSGLANPAFFNWETQLAAQVRAHHPDLVLIMLGANDNKNLPSEEGRLLIFGSREWESAYAARLARLHAIIRADNPSARVYFLGVPVMAESAFDAEMLRINGVLAATAKRLPGCAYVETRDVLADAAGAFATMGKAADGSMVRLRADDGVHISGAGSRMLAARCLEAVSGAAGLAEAELLAGLADRDVRPVAGTPAGRVPTQLAEARQSPAPAARPAAVALKPAPAPAAATYQVAEGDTLWSVARRLGTSPERLAEANPGLAPRRLSIGQRLAVPAGAAPVALAFRDEAKPQPQAPAASPAPRTHTVAEGDNFWSVAKRHDVSVAALTTANPGVEPTRLRIGQSLAIPEAGRAVPAQTAAVPASPSGVYTVSDGDNFWSIAHRLGLGVGDLKRANAAVDPRKLQPGQVLTLPGGARAEGLPTQPQARTEVSGPGIVGDAGLYPVAKGDTLWALSRRFGVSLETMLAVNGAVDPSRLQVGQLLTVPGTGQPVVSAEMLLFPVSAGDTLWAIARRFDVSVEALAAANPGVDPLRLREGQTLRVPSSLAAVAAPGREAERPLPAVSGEPARVHAVEPGDTLWELSRRFGVSVDMILAENAGLDPVRLRVGQSLRLPVAAGPVVSMAAR